MESGLISLKFIVVGLTSFSMLGAAIGIGNIFSSLLNGIARNPATENKLMKAAFIGAGFFWVLFDRLLGIPTPGIGSF